MSARRPGTSPGIAEKDYWATEVLGASLQGRDILVEGFRDHRTVMGCRGGPIPNKVCSIRSFMSEVADETDSGSSADYDDLAPFELTVLAPERTLAEKLAFLHHRASVRELTQLKGGVRHLYDVYRLLGYEPTAGWFRLDRH